MKIQSKNILLMNIMQVIGGLLFFLPIIALYLESELATITNVAIIFAVEAIAITVFETPTGAIADLFGRKKTITTAMISVLIGLIFLFIGKSMIFFVLFAVFNSLGRSLVSGTDSALIYDTLKNEDREKDFKKIIGKYYALWPMGAIIGSLVGGYIANISLKSTVSFTFIPILIVLILTFFLEEPKYKKENHKNISLHLFNVSKDIIKNKQLILLSIAGFIVWGIGESVHRLNSIFFDFKQIPMIYIGIVSAIIFAFSSIGHYYSNQVSEKIGDKKTLILASVGTPILMICATLTSKYLSGLLWAIPSIFFGLRNPIIEHLINRETESNKRATMISSYNFIKNLGMTLFSLVIGYHAKLYDINTAFRLFALVLFIAPIIYYFIKDKNENRNHSVQIRSSQC